MSVCLETPLTQVAEAQAPEEKNELLGLFRFLQDLMLQDAPLAPRKTMFENRSLSRWELETRPLAAVAAQFGSVDLLKWLFSQGIDLKRKTALGRSAMWYAVQCGHVEVCKYLQLQGISKSGMDMTGTTLLATCIENGKVETLKWLLANGATLNYGKASTEPTPFMIAAKSGKIEMLDFLFESFSSTAPDASTSKKRSLRFELHKIQSEDHVLLKRKAPSDSGVGKKRALKALNQDDANGNNALLYACESGSISAVDWIVERVGREIVPSSRNLARKGALLVAAQHGHLALLQHFIDVYNCDVDSESSSIYTVASVAACAGHINILEWLKQTLRYDFETPAKPFHAKAFVDAAFEGNLQVIKWFIEQGLSPTSIGLMLSPAALKGHIDILRFLFSIAPKSFEENLSQNPVHNILLNVAYGTHKRHVDILDWLFDIGLCTDKAVETEQAISIAASQGSVSILQLLHKRGVDIHMGNKESLASVAVRKNDMKLLKWLISINSPLEVCNRFCWPAVHEAVWTSNISMLELLVASGCGRDLIDPIHGFTPLTVAALVGEPDVINWLVLNGSSLNNLSPKQSTTPLLSAATAGNLEALKALVALGASLFHTPAHLPKTLFETTIEQGRLDIAKWLLRHGVNPYERRNPVPLQETASAKGHISMAEWLASLGL